jgi:hypothetical protein
MSEGVVDMIKSRYFSDKKIDITAVLNGCGFKPMIVNRKS